MLQLMEINVAELTCTQTHGLSEDAISARLHRGTLPCLTLHWLLDVHLYEDALHSQIQWPCRHEYRWTD